MKIAALLLFLFLPSPISVGQEAVKPVRVEITSGSDEDGYSYELESKLRADLQRLRYVIITEQRPDWRLVFAVSKDKCGFIAAMVAVDMRGRSFLSLHTAPDMESLTGHLTDKVKADFLENRK